MARMLVTGAAGFIGSHLVDRLLGLGHDVVGVDDLSTGREENLRAARASGSAFDFHRLDIATDDLSGAFSPSPDVVLHLAAQIDVRKSVADPVHDAMTNIVGTIRLLEASRRPGARKLVHTSSGGCVYGEPEAEALPVPETYPGHPHSPYGASKRAVEEYFHTYEVLYGLRWTALALGNVYGPRQDPGGEAGVVSIFGGRLLAGEPVTIFGDGEQTRDFVFVSDVVDAFVAALERGDGQRINIGTGEQTSVNALYAEVARIVGVQAAARYAPARPGELQRIALDVTRAREELGWKPATALPDGLGAVVQWLQAG
jgi:UDP-glucose 4-epimerase